MTRPFMSWVRPFIEIRPSEQPKTFLMFLYFFFSVACIYVLKPVQKSLFLAEFGASRLRYAYMGEGIFLFLVVTLYVHFAKRASGKVFQTRILAFIISNLFIFRLLLHFHVPYTSGLFYLWVASFSVTVTTVFWTFANDLFHAQEAKRLFGIIASGGSLGGILGGVLTQQAVRWLRTEDLILLAGVLLMFCLLLIQRIWREVPVPPASADAAEGKAAKADRRRSRTEKAMPQSVRKIFIGSSYLVMLALLVMIPKMVSTVIDNQFSGVVQMSIQGKEAVTAFLGGFFALLNLLSFLIQFILTGFSLRQIGVGRSLSILPLGLLALAVPSFLFPVLLTALALRLYDGSVNYSLQLAGKEILFLPLSRPLRYQIKPVIDMLGFRVAKTLGGVYIALAAPLLGLTDETLGGLVLALIPFWIFLIWRMKKEYSRLLREHLLNWRFDQRIFAGHSARDLKNLFRERRHFQRARFLFRHPSSVIRKLAATAYVVYTKTCGDLEYSRQFLDHIRRYEGLDAESSSEVMKDLDEKDLAFLERMFSAEASEEAAPGARTKAHDGIFKKMRKLLCDPNKGLEVKRRVVRIVEQIVHHESVQILSEALKQTADYPLRFVILRALNRLRERNSFLEIDRDRLKSEIFREVETQQSLRKLYSFYFSKPRRNRKTAYLRVALNTLMAESRERIFYALNLFYPAKIVSVIDQNLDHGKATRAQRAHLRGILEDYLEPEIARPLAQLTNVPKTTDEDEPDIVQILRGFSLSEDRWLSLTSLFYISEAGLEKRWQGLAALQEDLRFDRLVFK